MTLRYAKKIVGNQPLFVIRNMIATLKMRRVLNNEEENQLLKAAETILKWNKIPKDYKGGIEK
jgi:hypothetical protein